MRYPIIEYVLMFMLFMCMALAMVGCAHVKPVIAPSVHEHEKDSVRTEVRYDSVFVDRWHTILQKGDTIRIHDSIYVQHFKHDSIFINIGEHTTDTISVVVEVEKKGSEFWKGSGIAFWILLGLLVIGCIVGIIIKFAK